MLTGSRSLGAVLFLGATIALVGFTLAPTYVPTAPAAPLTPSATETAPVLAPAAPDTVIAVSSRAASSSAAAAHNAMVAATIRAEGSDWIGIPYRWGGTTRRGIDCSAFVQQLMRATFDLELPRTTATQVHRGERISRDELIPGDLVFFRRRGVRHVGVYMGDGDFIHASSSRGVTVSNLSSNYYTRHYWQARRVLPTFEPVIDEPTSLGDVEVAPVRSTSGVRN
ncbi:MAG: NlpC/P60 family protein [Bacteroidota bacterium]